MVLAKIKPCFKRTAIIKIEAIFINNSDGRGMDEGDWAQSTVVITDESGKETEFFIIDEIEYKGETYLLVIETEFIEDDEAEAVIFKEVGEDKDDLVYEEPEDEEFEAVIKLFGERLEDYDIEI